MKKKTVLKLGSLITASVMIASCLSGCGEKKSGSADTAEFSYWCSMDSNAVSTLQTYNDMEIYKEAEEMLGIRLNFSHPAVGQEAEQFNLKVASDSLDDIMEYTWSKYSGGPEQAISDGLIVPLNEYIENGHAPNLKKILDENPDIAKQMKTDDGTIYAMPCIGLNAVSVTTGFMVRGDWLEELGLEKPETIAEWENVLIQFKEKKGASAPFTGTGEQILTSNPFCGAFDCGISFYLKDGKVAYGPLEDGYRKYISMLRDWYAKGLIDIDVFGNNSKTIESNLVNGKSGAVFGGIGGVMGNVTHAARGSDPNFKLVGVKFPVEQKGQISKYAPRAWEVRTAGMGAITTNNKNPEKAVEFLDIFYGGKGVLMKNFGIEGKTYILEDGEPVYTDEILNNPDGLSVAQALGKYTRASMPSPGLIHPGYYEGYYQLDEQKEAMKLWNENADEALSTLLPQVTPNADEAEELASILSSLNTYVEEQATQFMLGQKDMSEFDSFVQSLFGMKVERAIEIYQAAYERYLKR